MMRLRHDTLAPRPKPLIAIVVVTRTGFPSSVMRIINEGTPSARAAFEMFEIQPKTETIMVLVGLTLPSPQPAIPVASPPTASLEPRKPKAAETEEDRMIRLWNDPTLQYSVPQDKVRRMERIGGSVRARQNRETLRELHGWHGRRTMHRTEELMIPQQILPEVHRQLAILDVDGLVHEHRELRTYNKHQGKKTRKARKIRTSNGADPILSQLGIILSRLRKLTAEKNYSDRGEINQKIGHGLERYRRQVETLTRDVRRREISVLEALKIAIGIFKGVKGLFETIGTEYKVFDCDNHESRNFAKVRQICTKTVPKCADLMKEVQKTEESARAVPESKAR